MSQPQDSKSNFMQVLLFCAVIFMGVQLWQQSQHPAKADDTRTAAELWSILQQENKDALDVSITRDAAAWETKFKAEADKKHLTPAQVDAEILKSHVLIADTRLKSAEYWPANAHDKIQKGYDVLKSTFERDVDSPVWDEKVQVTPDNKFTATETSPRELYSYIVSDLAVRNKTQLVYGLFPGYPVIDFLVALTGRQPGLSYAFAAFLLALIVRGSVWPLSQKQYIWGRRMQQMQPYLRELEEKHRDPKTKIVDQAAYQQDTMKLYKEYGLNPFAGCGPALIQIPFFFTIYQCMQLYRFEFTKGHFLWIHPGATKILGIHVSQNLGERDYILIVIYGITMLITSFMTPVSDATQMKQQRLMGMVFAVGVAVSMFFYPLASAFILYWIFTNVLATIQSLLVSRKKLPELVKVATSVGGLLPKGSTITDAQAISSDFFTKTGTKKANKQKKKN